jgi:NADPH:quinone reductase-like Zn-dependent oxidoreductase
MRAIVFEEYGGPEVLHPSEVTVPEPGPGEVLVRVRRAGVNPIDGKVRSGAMADFAPVEFPSVPGQEFAGTVAALGPGTQTELAVGDHVLGWPPAAAGYAPYALSRPDLLAGKPDALSWDVAAALPVAAETAGRVLDLLAPEPGETLLIHGASGAVGSLAAQLAHARGVSVIGTGSSANQAFLRALGIQSVVYGEGLVERVRELAPKGADAVFDAVGAPGVLADSITLRGGVADRIVSIAAPVEAARLGVAFSGGAGVRKSARRVAEAAEAAARGDLRIEIGEIRPLVEAADLQRLSDTGHAHGKLILRVD